MSQGSKNTIVYNVLQTGSGWQIQALLPRRISPDDRIKVIDWLHFYRSTIRNQHPFWITNFNATDQGYFLDVLPASGPRDMIGRAVQDALQWKQMNLFEYAQQ